MTDPVVYLLSLIIILPFLGLAWWLLTLIGMAITGSQRPSLVMHAGIAVAMLAVLGATL